MYAVHILLISVRVGKRGLHSCSVCMIPRTHKMRLAQSEGYCEMNKMSELSKTIPEIERHIIKQGQ